MINHKNVFEFEGLFKKQKIWLPLFFWTTFCDMFEHGSSLKDVTTYLLLEFDQPSVLFSHLEVQVIPIFHCNFDYPIGGFDNAFKMGAQ